MRRILLAFILLFGQVAWAGQTLQPIPETVRSKVPPPEMEVKSWILADFESGWILGSHNADERIEPASLTKLMTSFLAFEAITNGDVKLDDEVYVSRKAWRTGGSRMFIQVDTKVRVEDLLRGLIVQSGNDAAVALAEHLGGSEEGFAAMMNQKAAELGMTNSRFTNSNGLPDENHYSTAHDMTLLALSLIRAYPELYRIYSEREFTYNGITQGNRNVLLTRDATVDGIKTGYTRNAGYCLIGTARRDGTRLMATVIGSKSRKTRADQVQSLLQYGYATYDGMLVYAPGTAVKRLPLWMGEQPEIDISVNNNLGILYPKGNRDKLSAALDLPESLEAPLADGQQVGTIEVKYDGEPIRKASLHVTGEHPEGPWWSQLIDSVKQFIY